MGIEVYPSNWCLYLKVTFQSVLVGELRCLFLNYKCTGWQSDLQLENQDRRHFHKSEA